MAWKLCGDTDCSDWTMCRHEQATRILARWCGERRIRISGSELMALAKKIVCRKEGYGRLRQLATYGLGEGYHETADAVCGAL